jgi:hypothetical protein
MVIVTATNYSGPEVQFEEIAIDLPKPVSGLRDETLEGARIYFRLADFNSFVFAVTSHLVEDIDRQGAPMILRSVPAFETRTSSPLPLC